MEPYDREVEPQSSTRRGAFRSVPGDWPALSVDMTTQAALEAALMVVGAIEAGNVAPLADHIRENRGQIHPQIALLLHDLVVGSKDRTGYRLSLGFHPEREPNERSPDEKADVAKKMAWLAANYLEALKTMRRKQALYHVATKLGVTERQVSDARTMWGKSPTVRALADYYAPVSPGPAEIP